MNFKLIKIPSSDDEHYHESSKPSHFIKTDAFTVLPPFSPQIPGPPPTPNPYRILPPIVSRRRPSFVILQEVGSRPASREPSPSGRVSPFRGCGFKPSSRETSPSRPPSENEPENKVRRLSRSRLPVAINRKVSKSVSPVGTKTSNIPKPLNRRISYSPNRAKKVLTEISNNQINRKNCSPTVSSLKNLEHLQSRHRPVSESNLKEFKNANINQKESQTFSAKQKPQKPPIPNKPKTTMQSNTQTPVKMAEKKLTSSTPQSSPTKVGKVQVTKSPIRKVAQVVSNKPPISPVRGKTILPKSPAKVTSSRSKENLSPSLKISSPVKTLKPSLKMTTPPVKTPKSPLKLPPKSPTKPMVKKRLPEKGQKEEQRENTVPVAVKEETTAATTVSNSISKPLTNPTKTEKIMSVHSVGKKALTTSSLLNSIKKKNEMDKKQGATIEGEKDGKEQKKDLPHTDTSTSLPLSIGTSGMTDSSVTLIRTTTEPALAPVQPDLISEIRTAINEVRNTDETQCSKQEMLKATMDPTSVKEKSIPTKSTSVQIPVSVSAATLEMSEPKLLAKITTEEKVVLLKEKETLQKCEPVASTPEVEPKNSPQSTHVVAITKIITEPKQEITSNVVKIKQEKENEVQSANVTTQSETRNGISKSSWLNEKNEKESMKNLTSKNTKKKPSTECLVEPVKASCWKKFISKCPKCMRKCETRPLQISTISKTRDTTAKVPRNKSSFGKYFCCFCHKCELKKEQTISTIKNADPSAKRCNCLPKLCCFKCKNSFKNLVGKLSCRNGKRVTKSAVSKTESGVACIDTIQPEERNTCCTGPKDRMLKCLSILCCWNKAFCIKIRGRCRKWCSCCTKCCSRCSRSKTTVITEPERRKSTISTIRKRKWTRVFTDFPKLDASFVEHGSVMRGAIPVLPVPLAWICLILNVFLPGFGTLSSGIFCLFVGKPRFSINDSILSRIGSFVVNLLVAGSQLFTVLFCLVGWGWSIWWGVIMLKMAKKNKRILMAEQVIPSHITSTVDQNHDIERGGIVT